MTNVIATLPVIQLNGVDPILIAVVVIAAAIVIGLYLWWIGWAVFKKPLTGPEALVGKRGVASSDLMMVDGGEVSIDGVIWNAKLASDAVGKISKGDTVVVIGVSSLTLIVRRPGTSEK